MVCLYRGFDANTETGALPVHGSCLGMFLQASPLIKGRRDRVAETILDMDLMMKTMKGHADHEPSSSSEHESLTTIRITRVRNDAIVITLSVTRECPVTKS